MTVPARFRRLFESALARFWAWRRPVTPNPQNVPATAPSDNLQRSMNLVMPLRDPTAVGRARVLATVAAAADELSAGLNNVGTVHFARFDIIAGNLCMISVYDGDFGNYIRDFIVAFGSVFDAIMDVVVDPAPTPCTEHPQQFIDWVAAHDAFQLPGQITSLLPPTHDVLSLPREVVEVMHAAPTVQVAMYRGYPGVSAAQIRDATGLGW